MREKNYFFRFYTKFQFLSDLEVVLIGEVVILVVVTGGKKSQPSLPLDFNWIWIVLDRIWLEFDKKERKNNAKFSGQSPPKNLFQKIIFSQFQFRLKTACGVCALRVSEHPLWRTRYWSMSSHRPSVRNQLHDVITCLLRAAQQPAEPTEEGWAIGRSHRLYRGNGS